MAEKDYYKILGVERTASADEIKKAYRKLAHLHHPDKFLGDKEVEEKFKGINEAYEILKDPDKKARYDRFGVGERGRGAEEAGFGADFQDFFGDMFSEFFGGRRGRGAERGRDLKYDLTIPFEEAVFGATKKIDIPRIIECPVCRGSRAKPGTSPRTCSNCGGSGESRFRQGFLTIQRPCSACRGQGVIIENPCGECSGNGVVRKTQTLTVNIPAGADDGNRVRVSGHGDPGERGGPPGDLYIFLTVKPHPIFKRENGNILCEVPISFPQAALGSEIEVPTIEGTTRLKIPAGTQSGKTFRLKNKGVVDIGSGRRGDQLIYVKVEIPAKLDKRQRELIEEFARISNEDMLPQKKSFFEKVKEVFG